MKKLIAIAALFLTGCVAQAQDTTKAVKPEEPKQLQHVVKVVGAEKAVTLNGLHKIVIVVENRGTAACQMQARFSGLTFDTTVRDTCDQAIVELMQNINALVKQVNQKEE